MSLRAPIRVRTDICMQCECPDKTAKVEEDTQTSLHVLCASPRLAECYYTPVQHTTTTTSIHVHDIKV